MLVRRRQEQPGLRADRGHPPDPNICVSIRRLEKVPETARVTVLADPRPDIIMVRCTSPSIKNQSKSLFQPNSLLYSVSS